MADVTGNTFTDTANRKELIFQKGRDVLDVELNELQRIQMFERFMDTAVRGGTGVGGSGFSAEGTGASNDLTIKAGYVTVQGLTYRLATDTLLSVLMSTATPLPTRGSNQTDWVYVDFQLIEVDALTDPTIAVAALGETARRVVLRATWGVNATTLGTPGGAGNLYAGGVVRVPIATVRRSTGVATVSQTSVVTHTPVERTTAAFMDASTHLSLMQNAIVSWNRSTGELYIGDAADTGLTTTGLQVVFPGGATYIVQGSFTLAAGQGLFLNPKRFATNSWTGSTLGIYTQGTSLADVDSPVTVAALDSAPGFLLAARFEGGQLMLRNGRVIRVPSTINELKLGSWQGPDMRHEELVITVGTGGTSYGDFNTLLGALQCIPTTGTSPIRTRIILKEGTHDISAPSSVANYFSQTWLSLVNARIVIEGVGKTSTFLVIDSTNISGDVLQFVGEDTDVVFRDLTLSLGAGDADVTHLAFTVRNLRIERCSFDCRVYITAGASDSTVYVADSEFDSPSATDLGITFYSSFATTPAKWERCTFSRTNQFLFMESLGWASLVFNDCLFLASASGSDIQVLTVGGAAGNPAPRRVTFTRCEWRATVADAGAPVRISGGRLVELYDNLITDTGSGAGWDCARLVDLVYSLGGEAAYRVNIKMRGNTILGTPTQQASITGVAIRVGGGIVCESVKIDDNSVIFGSGMDAGVTTVEGIVIDDTGLGNSVYMGGTVKNNVVNVHDTYPGIFRGVHIGPGSSYAAGTQEISNIAVGGNSIRAKAAGDTASTTAYGVLVEAPARGCTVEGNTVELQLAGGMGAGSDSVGVVCGSGTLATVINDNTIIAENPVDVSAANIDAYVHGNHTKRCDNPAASRGGIGAGSTFNVAGSYAAIGNVTDNKHA